MDTGSGRQQWDIASGVGVTALAVAAARAAESARPDPLVVDPYAARFLAAAPSSARMPGPADEPHGAFGELWPVLAQYMGVRSRVFDDFFADATRRGVRQVVLLASGLDTRAFRLEWPDGTVCFELDQPLVLDFKLRVLREAGARPGCRHRPVPVDLREDWAAALDAAGFDAGQPLAEGLLPYLPPQAEERLLKEVGRLSAPGSRLALEDAPDMAEILGEETLRQSTREFGIDLPALLPSGPRPPVQERLVALGWAYGSRSGRESAALLGRPFPAGSALPDRVAHVFAHRPSR